MRSMDIGRYIHNYEDFYKKFTHQMSRNREENDHNLQCTCKPRENSLISSLYLLVKRFEEEI